MSKREKRLQKLRQNPKNVSFDEVRQALEAEGFKVDHTTGSHYVFRAEAGDEVLTIVIPFRRPVKPAYIKQALAAIDKRHQVVPIEKEAEDDGEDD